jgi:hypothetical protein
MKKINAAENDKGSGENKDDHPAKIVKRTGGKGASKRKASAKASKKSESEGEKYHKEEEEEEEK